MNNVYADQIVLEVAHLNNKVQDSLLFVKLT